MLPGPAIPLTTGLYMYVYTILQSKPISSMDPYTQDMAEREREQKKQNLFPFIAQEKREQKHICRPTHMVQVK